ncbi:MAG: hypothetical protein ACK4WH_02315 [Phycisphaerales bacterium]
MKLSDVMGEAGLSVYPIVAMALFVAVFVAMVLKVMSRKARAGMDAAALLPLADDGAEQSGGTPSRERER